MRKPVALVAALTLLLALPLMSQAAPMGVTKAADLFAGKTTDVGDVFVWNDLTNFYVEINMDDGWCMSESHVIAAMGWADIPQASGNPIPGQFPAGDYYTPCADGDTFTFAIADVGADPYIAVHVKAWEKQVSTATIVSNPGDPVRYATSYPGGFGASVPGVVPSFAGWPAIAGASYISNQAAGDPFNQNFWRSVTETLTVPGLPIDGQLWVNSDNYEFTTLNGVEIQRDDNGPAATVENAAPEPAVSPQTWQTVENVAFMPTVGSNEFTFVFRNVTWAGGGSFTDNPTGLSYKAEAHYYAHSESAWAGTAVGVTGFAGKSWATYFQAHFAPVLIETLTVPAANPDGPDGTDSSILASGKSFQFKVAGTVTWTNRNGADLVDAECTSESGGPWAAAAAGYPDELLELQVDQGDVDWTPVGTTNDVGCATALHEYTLEFAGTGAAVNFRIYDGTGNMQDPAWFGDNAGSLTVEIWQTTP